jgi:hypothetical protein
MLGFIRSLSLEFRDPYTLKSLFTSLVRLKMEYASCVWNPFYNVRVDRVERYTLRGLDWTDMHDLSPYEDRCALLHLDTLAKRRSVACVMFIFDILSGRMSSSIFLSVLNLITLQYPTRTSLWTNYELHEPMSGAMRQFNEVICLFDFGLTRHQFLNRLRLTL